MHWQPEIGGGQPHTGKALATGLRPRECTGGGQSMPRAHSSQQEIRGEAGFAPGGRMGVSLPDTWGGRPVSGIDAGGTSRDRGQEP